MVQLVTGPPATLVLLVVSPAHPLALAGAMAVIVGLLAAVAASGTEIREWYRDGCDGAGEGNNGVWGVHCVGWLVCRDKVTGREDLERGLD
jgi:hypothetical protein